MPGTRPIRFTGTAEEAAANFATHNFFSTGYGDDGDYRCGDCDSRPSHAAARYPCGADVPREEF